MLTIDNTIDDSEDTSFNQSDVESIITTAFFVGDKDYDHRNHHGSGENRALAVRSGLRFGATKGKTKDAYYKMFCLNSQG